MKAWFAIIKRFTGLIYTAFDATWCLPGNRHIEGLVVIRKEILDGKEES
jgi:hypothetical protein